MVGLREDDAELVAAARAGDQAAFAAIFDRYSPRILAFCTRLLNEPHTAADATQDTFVAAAQRLDQLRDPASLRAWLYAIARNECTRHGRARGRAVPTEDAVMGETADDLTADEPATAAAAAEVGGLLWDAATGLDDSDRILLELHVRHGLEGAELAEAAGVSPGQISMVTGRMRERVARSVGALLIARKGRADCAGLQVVLKDWDGTFSVLTRKRVARHIDQCDTCEERRAALVAPLGTLAIAPAVVTFTVPDGALDGVRAQVLEAFDQHHADLGSLPPGMRTRRRRRVAAAAIVVMALTAAVVAALFASDEVDSVATGPATTAVAGASTSTTDPSQPKTTTTEAVATTSTSIAVSPNQSGTTTVPTTTPGGGPLVSPTTPPNAPPATSPPVTLAPPPTSPPATTAPNQAPSVGATSRSGSSAMQTSCNPANDTRTISVPVSDDRSVTAVVLRWTQAGGGSGQRAMARSGSTWSAALGPFASPGTVTYRAVATDADGASAASPSASVTVDPCPG